MLHAEQRDAAAAVLLLRAVLVRQREDTMEKLEERFNALPKKRDAHDTTRYSVNIKMW